MRVARELLTCGQSFATLYYLLLHQAGGALQLLIVCKNSGGLACFQAVPLSVRLLDRQALFDTRPIDARVLTGLEGLDHFSAQMCEAASGVLELASHTHPRLLHSEGAIEVRSMGQAMQWWGAKRLPLIRVCLTCRSAGGSAVLAVLVLPGSTSPACGVGAGTCAEQSCCNAAQCRPHRQVCCQTLAPLMVSSRSLDVAFRGIRLLVVAPYVP